MPLRILVVDDHSVFRDLVCGALRGRAEFQTIEAASGLEALQKVEALAPDVMLLDLNMPKMHGLEVARKLRGIAPQLPVLFMSQDSSPAIVQTALGLGGGRGFIHKISAATDLLPAIDAVLSGHRFVSRSIALAEPLDAPAPRRHEILFCSDDTAVIDGLAGFLAAALKAGGGGIALTTESHRAPLLHALRGEGVDVDGAVARGTCRFFDADVPPDFAGLLEALDGVRAAAASAGKASPRIAVCGERAGCLWAAGRTAEAIEIEQMCGRFAPDVDILCTYPMSYTNDGQALRRICADHTAVSAA
jgi:DNA-binding NarL/FixJ family response regulator